MYNRNEEVDVLLFKKKGCRVLFITLKPTTVVPRPNMHEHYWRASEASETPSIATYRKKCVYSMYVKTTMRMLTILHEAEEWMHVHLREARLLFASAITKSSLYVRQSACTSNNFTFARPLMGTIF